MQEEDLGGRERGEALRSGGMEAPGVGGSRRRGDETRCRRSSRRPCSLPPALSSKAPRAMSASRAIPPVFAPRVQLVLCCASSAPPLLLLRLPWLPALHSGIRAGRKGGREGERERGSERGRERGRERGKEGGREVRFTGSWALATGGCWQNVCQSPLPSTAFMVREIASKDMSTCCVRTSVCACNIREFT